MILLAALLAVQSINTGDADLKPATTAAIAAGGKACLGATVDPAGQDARLAGWTDLAPAQKAGMKIEGRAVTRDNVMIAQKPGIDGGCVVMATAAPGFDKAALLAALGAAAGVPIGTDPKNPVTNLPNGELMVVQIGADEKNTGVMLVVANQQNRHVKQSPTAASPSSPSLKGK